MPNATGSTTIGATADSDLNSVLSGNRWNGDILTYNFPTVQSYYPAGYISGSGAPSDWPSGFVAASASFQTMFGIALAQYSAVANLRFNLVDSAAASNMSVARTALLGTTAGNAYNGWGFYPGSIARGGDTWFAASTTDVGDNYVLGRGTFRLVMHEIGHSLGLKHSQDTGGLAGPMSAAHDFQDYTVMSYRQYQGGSTSVGTRETFGAAQSLMMYDILGVQTMYGANYTTNSGNSTYTFNSTTGEMSINGVGTGAPGANRIYRTVWDGGGTDTYDLSNYTTNLNIDLAPGGRSTFNTAQLAIVNTGTGLTATGNLFNAMLYNGDTQSLIENAFGGTGNDAIVGNQADNVLFGGAGNDMLSGAIGNDYVDGGLGNDNLYGGDGNDVVIGAEGNNVIYGDGGNDFLYGGAGFNQLFGGAGDDNITVLGSVGSTQDVDAGDGNDFIYGGAFDDNLFGSIGNDNIQGGAGNDSLYGGEGLNFLYGGAGDDYISSGTATNITVGLNFMYGGDGADFLSGGGGAGDFMFGGIGTDSVYGGNGADYIWGGAGSNTLSGGDGNDFILSSGETGGDVATGDAGDDYLFLGDGVDTGYGGAGTDVLFGAGGNDVVNGGAGQDYLWGGAGADQFQLVNGNGTEVVYDWGAGDRVQVATAMYADFAAISAGHIGYNAASNTTVIFNPDASSYIVLLNTNITTINATSFSFV
jgi:serralysin